MQHHGLDANENIKQKKSFRNPSIYQKLIDFLDIDEGGSNFPKDVFDPKRFREDKKNDYIVSFFLTLGPNLSFRKKFLKRVVLSDRPFQAIASLQRSNEERRQAAMKERSKVSRKFSKLKIIKKSTRPF